jgi:predicted dehydrogenase
MKLVILDPGHFHAALVQKRMYADVDPTVAVYAPDGPDLDDYLRKIALYNARADDPTHWQIRVHAGDDYLERFAAERAGDIVVIAGNNQRKAEYLARAVEAGFDVLGDKPMAIDAAGFAALERTFARAREQGVLLHDIMTERHEITTMLQKAFSAIAPLFGKLLPGTADLPAVTKESVHHFAKLVSGTPIKRPAWFFDVAQQGEGLVDITTHLVDLVQWECFPAAILEYADIEILAAKRWPTILSCAEFERVTQLADFPGFLRKDVRPDGMLHVYANGEILYRLRGVYAKVSVRWDFEAPAGAGDTHFSVMRGSRADLVIRQGATEGFQPTLYIEPCTGEASADFARVLEAAVLEVSATYPGVGVQRHGDGWRVTVPATYHVGHEAHFGQVADQFLGYCKRRNLPDWEVPNTLAKYYTTTRALALAKAGDGGCYL